MPICAGCESHLHGIRRSIKYDGGSAYCPVCFPTTTQKNYGGDRSASAAYNTDSINLNSQRAFQAGRATSSSQALSPNLGIAGLNRGATLALTQGTRAYDTFPRTHQFDPTPYFQPQSARREYSTGTGPQNQSWNQSGSYSTAYGDVGPRELRWGAVAPEKRTASQWGEYLKDQSDVTSSMQAAMDKALGPGSRWL